MLLGLLAKQHCMTKALYYFAPDATQQINLVELVSLGSRLSYGA